MGRAATAEELDDLLGPSPAPAKRPTPWANTQVGPSRLGLNKYAANGFGQKKMMNIITCLREIPVVAVMLRRVGMSNTALKYRLHESEGGIEGDQYELLMNPDAPEEDRYFMRFHEAYDEALQIGLGKAEEVLFTRATGYNRVLYHQGRVTYKEDPNLLELGFIGPSAYLLDRNGQPIPETVWEQDPDLLKYLLTHRKPDTYGNRQQIDVTHRGGVLVVSQKAKTGEDLNTEEQQYRKEVIDVEFEEVSDDDA